MSVEEVIAAGKNLKSDFEKLKKQLVLSKATAAEEVEEVKSLHSSVDTIVEQIPTDFESMFEELKDSLEQLRSGVPEFVQECEEIPEEVLNQIEERIDSSIERMSSLGKEFSDRFVSLVDSAQDSCVGLAGDFEQGLGLANERVNESIESAVSRVKNAEVRVTQMFQSLQHMFEGVSEAQQSASSGLQVAIAAINSLQQTMEEIR